MAFISSRIFTRPIALDAGTASTPVLRPAAAPAVVQRFSPAMLDQVLVRVAPPVVMPPNLPVADTQSGNLFHDRSNSGIRWYLPDYVMANTPDPFFSFSATQTGETDANGNPFNTGTLTLTLQKKIPQDATAFQAANPATTLREIPLHISSVTLTTTFRDPDTGQPKQASYQGVVSTAADGSLQLTFDNGIVGPAVIVLYQNLTASGGAQVSLAGSFDVVFRQAGQGQQAAPPPAAVLAHYRAFNSPEDFEVPEVRPQMRYVAFRAQPLPAPRTLALAQPAPEPGTPGNYVQGTMPHSWPLPLSTGFAASAYQLKFTLTTPAGRRTILGVQDLKSFNVPQTEFIELKSLGDISVRYPTLSRLYLGVLSRTIVVIPARYTIARGKDGCFALCQALVDSSPSSASKCKFQFTFNLASDASPVELLELSKEIAAHPELKDHLIKLPDLLGDHPAPALETTFQTAFHYAASGEPHIFTLSVDVRDDDVNSPAIANANLLIAALAAPKAPYLIGTIGLKLDDGYPSPVQSTVVLNFAQTSGTDDLSFTVDQTSQTIQLTNRSPLDLNIARCALTVQQGMNVYSLNQKIAGGQSTTLPLPPNHDGLVLAAEAELALPARMTKADVSRYLPIFVQDVADTQFSFSVNSSGVNYTKRSIDHIDVQVTFAALPQLTPPSFSLNKLHTVDGTRILVPIQHAITELKGTALFTVHFLDPQKPAVQFTLQNDFCSQPDLVLNDSDMRSG